MDSDNTVTVPPNKSDFFTNLKWLSEYYGILLYTILRTVRTVRLLRYYFVHITWGLFVERNVLFTSHFSPLYSTYEIRLKYWEINTQLWYWYISVKVYNAVCVVFTKVKCSNLPCIVFCWICVWICKTSKPSIVV